MDTAATSQISIINHGSPQEEIELEYGSSITIDHYAVDVEEAQQQPLANVASRQDVPPDGGYGWVCTACVFMINAHVWGPNSAWGVFLNYYLYNSTFPGSTQLQFALIGGLSISQSLIISPLISLANKRLGSRFTLTLGTALVSIALLAASFSTQMWHLFLSMGLCFGYGLGFLYITSTAMLPPWFSTRRSLAVGIASSGAGIGGLVYNLAAQRAIASLGIQNAYRVLAGTSLVANLVSSLLLKNCSSSVVTNQRIFNYRSLGRLSVLLIILWGTVTEMGYVTLFYSLPAYASSIGLSATQGSVAGALLNLGLGIGRPIVGYVSDKFGRINVAMVMTSFSGFLCLFLWIPASTYGVLLAFALLVGTACGTFWSTVAPVLADVVGIKDLAPVFGIICFSLVLPATFAEPAAMQIAGGSSGTLDYRNTQIFVGCMFLIGGMSLWVLRSWKICDDEKRKNGELASPRDGERGNAWHEWKQYLRLLLRNCLMPCKV